MTTVALDGFGAEHGTSVVLEAARLLSADGIGVRVFGAAAELAELQGFPGVQVFDTSQHVTNDDDPLRAIRAMPESSIVRAAADVAAGNADAMVSAGPTGATLAAGTFGLKRLTGVQRPGLAARLPIPGAPALLLDCGANAEVRARHLVQFAVLGSAFSSAVLGIEHPRVGLLSNGEEPKKGTPEVVEAHQRLAGAALLNFVGNVEGGDLTSGAADVIVTDGFTGNVALKTLEGTARMMEAAVKDAARSNPVSAAGGLLLRPSLGRLRTAADPNATGGALLLGLRAPCVVAHGSASGEGLANAGRLAVRSVRDRAVDRTAELLKETGLDRAALRDGE